MRRRSRDGDEITIRALTADDWPIIEELFGRNGACGGCWCMWPRVPKGGKTWETAKGAKNRASFRRLVKNGKVHGVLAFTGRTPIGWCCFGPRADFPRLERVRALKSNWGADTWSIVCFYIPARWRSQGIATRLLQAATARAFDLGAREIEGYPVVPKDSQKPIPPIFAWTGVPAMFETTAYDRQARPDATRPLYRKQPPKRSKRSRTRT